MRAENRAIARNRANFTIKSNIWGPPVHIYLLYTYIVRQQNSDFKAAENFFKKAAGLFPEGSFRQSWKKR